MTMVFSIECCSDIANNRVKGRKGEWNKDRYVDGKSLNIYIIGWNWHVLCMNAHSHHKPMRHSIKLFVGEIEEKRNRDYSKDVTWLNTHVTNSLPVAWRLIRVYIHTHSWCKLQRSSPKNEWTEFRIIQIKYL